MDDENRIKFGMKPIDCKYLQKCTEYVKGDLSIMNNELNKANERVIIDGKEVVPLMGKVVVELLPETVQEHLQKQYKMGDELKKIGFQVAETGDNKGTVPLRMAKVLDMASDAFGKRFMREFGDDQTEKPRIGDIVMFTNYQQFNLDKVGKYALLTDDRIFCILREVE